VLCPLAHEAKAINAKLGRDCRVLTTGQGPERITRAIEELDPASGHWVVLLGVAGGLSIDSGAHAADLVLDREGRTYTPSLRAHAGVTVLGVDEPIFEPEVKHALAVSTGAALVDCESHAFARAAQARNLAWGVVRAVSDGGSDALPKQATGWIDDRGRTRLVRVAADVVRHPSLLRTLMRISGRTEEALHEAVEIVKELRPAASAEGAP